MIQKAELTVMENIKLLLSGLKGVNAVSLIPKAEREKIIDLEKGYERNGVIGLKNIGIRMVLQCDVVFAILKDTSFRPPPDATVLMVEDYKDNNPECDHLVEINGNKYRIVGEELIDKKLPAEENYIFISDDFVLYPERRSGTKKEPAYFLIPPITFNELEESKDQLGINNIISISPSTQADDYIRGICKFSLSDKLATILVGFDKIT